LLLTVYSTFLKRLPIVGNILVALLGAYSIYILFEFDTNLVQMPIYVFCLNAFFIHFIRELIKDVEDVMGDIDCSMKYVHHFIWVDKSKFRKDISYRNSIFSSLATLTADTVIAPAYCRDVFLEDSIAAVIPAKHKWAWDQKDYLPWKKKFQEKVFTQLIPDTDIPIFMGEINLAFMNRVGMKESKFINKLGFPLNSEKPINPYIVVFPGAGARQKMWAINNYIEIIHKLVETPFRIKICGGPGDLALGERIQREFINTNRVENLCGKTNLVELGNLLGNASLIITNDTSAAHFAGIAKTKVIVILNGNNYGAFFPYPRDYTNVNCIYPPDIANELNAHAYLHWKGAGEMNGIIVNQVWEKIIEELITL
jgi:ADP-heptose:LPS heptosyltransferase